MICRPLRATWCSGAGDRPLFAALDDDIARFDEFGIAVAALRHQVSGVSTELVDVELVVGEQYEVLKVAWAGGRVVRQAMQRIVDALCSELRQRPRSAHRRFVCAVGDLIVGSVKVWNVEQVSNRSGWVIVVEKCPGVGIWP